MPHHDLLTATGLDAVLGDAFVLWYRADAPRSGWEVVYRGQTERECLDAIGCGGRRGGNWLILRAGAEPDR